MHYRFSLVLIVFLVVLFSFNQSRVSSELPSPEIELTRFIHQKIDARKAVKIDSFFTDWYEKGIFNGTVLIAEEGRIVYENAFGYADFRKKDSLRVNTPFQLASVSKPLTAAAVLMLYEDAKLSLDDDIRTFFPQLPYKDVTIRLLLTHRSGLPDYLYFADQYWPDRSVPLTNQDVIDLMVLYHPPIYYLPDHRYNYSNTNYALLAAIVEKVSGMDFGEFMKTNIFKPLGMRNSFVYNMGRHPHLPDGAVGYNRIGRPAANSYLNGVVGDKGIFSTVEDLLLFDRALYEGRLVRPSTLTLAYQPAHKDLYKYDNYGFGWRINASRKKNKIVYHTGWWKGYKTYFIRELGEEKTVIVLTNSARLPFIPVRLLENLI